MSSASTDHIEGLIANFSVLAAFIAALLAGIYKAFRKIKKEATHASPGAATGTGIIQGASLMDNTSILLWSESNRMVVASNERLHDEIVELRHAITNLERVMR